MIQRLPLSYRRSQRPRTEVPGRTINFPVRQESARHGSIASQHNASLGTSSELLLGTKVDAACPLLKSLPCQQVYRPPLISGGARALQTRSFDELESARPTNLSEDIMLVTKFVVVAGGAVAAGVATVATIGTVGGGIGRAVAVVGAISKNKDLIKIGSIMGALGAGAGMGALASGAMGLGTAAAWSATAGAGAAIEAAAQAGAEPSRRGIRRRGEIVSSTSTASRVLTDPSGRLLRQPSPGFWKSLDPTPR